MLVEDAVSRYLAELATVQEGTARAWSSALKRAAEPAGKYTKPPKDSRLNAADLRKAQQRAGKPRPGLGGRDLDEVTTSDLVMLLHAIQQEALTRKNGIQGFGSKETATTAVRALFSWARQNGLATSRPDDGLVYSKRESLERRAYTSDELARVVDVLDRTRDPELARLFFRLALETGARHGELLGLTVGSMRKDSGVLRLEGKGFQGGFSDAPITAALYDALERFVATRAVRVDERTPLLLTKAGKPITRRYWEHICEQVREKVPSLGVGEPDWFSAHGLRHTAATWVSRSAYGGGDAVARKFLHHSVRGRSHLENYTKATIEEVREVMVAIWGVPMAGNSHPYGVNGAAYLRIAALLEAAQRKQEQEDYELRMYGAGSGADEFEPSPSDFHEAEDRDRELREVEGMRAARRASAARPRS